MSFSDAWFFGYLAGYFAGNDPSKYQAMHNLGCTSWIIGAIACAVIAYLFGSINCGLLISKCYGKDIREYGSGNAGATNMLRTHGKGLAILTLICDALKGTIAVIIAACLDAFLTPGGTPDAWVIGNLKYIAGVFAVLGHDFPIFFGFRGGKGVATSLGVVLALNWQVGLIVCAVALTIMKTAPSSP